MTLNVVLAMMKLGRTRHEPEVSYISELPYG